MTDDAASTPPRLPTLAGLRSRPMVWTLLPGVALLLGGLGLFFGVLDTDREKDDLSSLDQPVLDYLVAHRTPGWTGLLAAITFVSGPTVLPIIVAVACLVWALVRRDWWRPALLAGAMVASTLISLSVKGLVGRERPPS
jgi:undecaprenyl-diphosphatase